MKFEEITFCLPTPKMLEEIIANTPNIPIETDPYWLKGYSPAQKFFVDDQGSPVNASRVYTDTRSSYALKVRPVLFFKEDQSGKKGDSIYVTIDKDPIPKSRECILLDKRRALLKYPIGYVFFQDNWDNLFKTRMFQDAW